MSEPTHGATAVVPYLGIHPEDGMDFGMRFAEAVVTRGVVSAATAPATNALLGLAGIAIPDIHLIIANVVSTVVVP